MIEPTPESAKTALNHAEVEQIKALAKQVRNSKHFKAILRDAKPNMRKGVYELIAPLLSFEVAPYDKLMKVQLRRERTQKVQR